ncbi:auxin-responsive protein SAUR32-like [Cucurbita maxima]|uniref:Auxin-responsive protein SAUR32-like n=1 Tax=Cucurbita maxima TaxID=3661 RepID=A0A6J1IHB8_CUCMA|nr:auxin-responsive protein SAUR32-like [Cucurbita maxima]
MGFGGGGGGGGGGDKHQHLLHLNFHFHIHLPHFHHHHHRNKVETPKGCLAILVGQQQERFVIPVIYVNHPLFAQLLKEAEDEYGFDQKGPIAIPCPVDDFRTLQGIIHHDHHPHHLLPISCFRDSSHPHC